jgi:hypothetical protein
LWQTGNPKLDFNIDSKGEIKMDNLRSIIFGLVLAVSLAFPMVVSADKVDGAPAIVIVQFGLPAPAVPPASHVLIPNDISINKGGTTTFEVFGGGHGIAIYPVSKDTVREDIEEGLCQAAVCDAATAALQYFVTDGKGDLIIDTDTNPPSNRVNDPTDRLLYVGGGSFLVNGNPPTVPATQVQYRFEKTGRYLVICINRSHFINDRMFGFVDVVGGDLD